MEKGGPEKLWNVAVPSKAAQTREEKGKEDMF